MAGVVHEHLLSGPVFLTHDQIQFAAPGTIQITEPAVLIAFRIGLLVLLPEEREGDSLPSHLLVNLYAVGYRTFSRGDGSNTWE